MGNRGNDPGKNIQGHDNIRSIFGRNLTSGFDKGQTQSNGENEHKSVTTKTDEARQDWTGEKGSLEGTDKIWPKSVRNSKVDQSPYSNVDTLSSFFFPILLV